MRLKNIHGVVVNVEDEFGKQLIASGTYTELVAGQGGDEPPKKLTAAQKRAKAKADAEAGQGGDEPDGAADDGSDTGSGAAADAG